MPTPRLSQLFTGKMPGGAVGPAIAAVAFIAFVLLCVLCTAPHRQREFTSDVLYLPSLYSDIALDPYPLSGWRLTPAPYLFPDMPVYFLLHRVTGDAGYAFAAYAVVFVAGFLGAMYFAARRLRVPSPFASALVVWGAVFSCLSLSPHSDLARIALFPTYHGSVALASVVFLGLLGDAPAEPLRGKKLGFVVALGALMTLADASTLTQVFAPLTLALAMARRRAAGGALRAAWGRDSTLLLLVPPLFAFLARLSLWLTTGIIVPPGLFASTALFTSSFWRGVAEAFGMLCVNHPLSVALGLAGLLAAGFSLRRFSRDAAGDDGHRGLFFSVFVVACFGSTLLFPVLTTNFKDASHWRHVLSCLLAAPMGLLTLADRLDRVFAGWRASGSMIVAVGASFSGSALASRIQLEKLGYATTYPESVACLDRIAEVEGLRRGVGDYWAAKLTTYHSRAGVRVNQFTSELKYRPWISNDAWLVEHDQSPIAYDFVLIQHWGGPDRLMRGENQAFVEERLGPPRTSADCGFYDVLVYDRKEDVTLRNFMQIRAREIRGLPLPSRIVEPAALFAQPYVRDMEPMSEKLGFAFDGPLLVRFAEPPRGDLVDVSAPANAHFRLVFFGPDGSELGALVVPSMPRPGKMRVRIISLPTGVRGAPIGSVRVEPLEGESAGRKLGHLFILTDAGPGVAH